jgi:hypothetical protein
MSYPWAQRGSPYRAQSTRFSSPVRISMFIEANPIAATGAVLISLAPFGALGLVATLLCAPLVTLLYAPSSGAPIG